jgi:putative ABC transport system ATP-binding protein
MVVELPSLDTVAPNVTQFAIEIERLVFQWPGRNGFRLSIRNSEYNGVNVSFCRSERQREGHTAGPARWCAGAPAMPPSRARYRPDSPIIGGRFRVDHLGFLFQQFNLVPYLSVHERTPALPVSQRRRQRAPGMAGSSSAGTNGADALLKSADHCSVS